MAGIKLQEVEGYACTRLVSLRLHMGYIDGEVPQFAVIPFHVFAHIFKGFLAEFRIHEFKISKQNDTPVLHFVQNKKFNVVAIDGLGNNSSALWSSCAINNFSAIEITNGRCNPRSNVSTLYK